MSLLQVDEEGVGALQSERYIKFVSGNHCHARINTIDETDQKVLLDFNDIDAACLQSSTDGTNDPLQRITWSAESLLYGIPKSCLANISTLPRSIWSFSSTGYTLASHRSYMQIRLSFILLIAFLSSNNGLVVG